MCLFNCSTIHAYVREKETRSCFLVSLNRTILQMILQGRVQNSVQNLHLRQLDTPLTFNKIRPNKWNYKATRTRFNSSRTYDRIVERLKDINNHKCIKHVFLENVRFSNVKIRHMICTKYILTSNKRRCRGIYFATAPLY